jgi:hypothetical protein
VRTPASFLGERNEQHIVLASVSFGFSHVDEDTHLENERSNNVMERERKKRAWCVEFI